MDYKQEQTSLSSYTMTKIPSAITKVIRSGPVNIRERSAFSGTRWKPRRLELDSQVLTIINVRRNDFFCLCSTILPPMSFNLRLRFPPARQ